MPSIDDFVNHRWDDAKEALAKLDPDFVGILELGLGMPEQYSVVDRPKRPLSKKWHRVLEACLELTMQSKNVQVAATSLTPEANEGLSRIEAGTRAAYHFRSWFIHARALSERTCDVIRKTAALYIVESRNHLRVSKRYRTSVHDQVTTRIERQRNDFLHANRSWATGITEEGLWEGHITIGMTPARFLGEFHYPAQGSHILAGKYGGYTFETSEMFDRIGKILQEFESELTGQVGNERQFDD